MPITRYFQRITEDPSRPGTVKTLYNRVVERIKSANQIGQRAGLPHPDNLRVALTEKCSHLSHATFSFCHQILAHCSNSAIAMLSKTAESGLQGGTKSQFSFKHWSSFEIEVWGLLWLECHGYLLCKLWWHEEGKAGIGNKSVHASVWTPAQYLRLPECAFRTKEMIFKRLFLC